MTPHTKRQDSETRSTGLRRVRLTLILLATACLSSAQTPGKAPTLTVAPVSLVRAQRAQQTMVNLDFRIPPGYHINSDRKSVV